MSYATVEDVEARVTRELDADEKNVCETLLEDAAVIIDAISPSRATQEAKKVVSCRMVARALGDGSNSGYPTGASQGSASALGYSQSWTLPSGGATGELYLAKLEKQMLGVGDTIGSYSPVQELAPEVNG